MVFCNGLDSVKEMIYLSVRDTFAVRGVSVLMVDQPGVGEALRLKALVAIHDGERCRAIENGDNRLMIMNRGNKLRVYQAF